MKKIAYSLMAMAIAAFTFTSCEDVPAPFGQPTDPGSGESGDVVVIEPSGSGTEADPYNVAAAIEIAKAMSADDAAKQVVACGYITSIDDIDTEGTYGNATYYISDDKDGKANKLEIYRGYGLNGQKFNAAGATIIKEGDFVVVSGGLVNFKGSTLEFTQGSKILSINGQGGGGTPSTETIGTKDDPITVAKALELTNALADNAESGEAFVKGKISKVQSYNSTYKSITYYISDDGTENNELQVYSGKGLNGADFASETDLAAGDVVIVKGKLKKYVNSKTGAITLEINQSSEIVSIVKGSGGGGGGTEASLGTADKPLTVAKALEIVNALADNGETETEAFVKGKISKVQSFSDKYKSITYYISDDGTENNELQIYSGKGLNGAEFAAAEDLSAGDVVIVKGKLKKYVNSKTGAITLEINQSSEIVSIVKGSGGGGGGTEASLGTADKPLTVAKALEIVNALADNGETETEAFVKGKISKVQSFSDKYKSITYYISDDGTENNELQIYSGKGLNGAEFAAAEDLSAGDVVVVKGKLKKYVNSKTGATTLEMNQPNEIVSITKASGGGGTEEAGEITAVFGDLGIGDDLGVVTLSDGTTLTFAQGGGKNKPIYHASTKIIRMYAQNEVTINAGSRKIAKVVFAYDTYNGTAYKGNDEMYGQAGNTKITPTKDDANVTFSGVNSSTLKVVNDFTSNSGGTQFRITGVTIIYAQ